jgi:hypothetical protein
LSARCGFCLRRSESQARRVFVSGDYKWVLSKARHPTFHSASYGIYSGAGGGLIFFVVLAPPEGNPDSFAFVPATAGTNIWDGTWHQVTGTWDGQFVSLYVNGELVESVDSFGGTLAYTNQFLNGDLLLGDVLGNPSEFHFPGDLDEVKYFDHALTAGDVMASFTNPNGPAGTTGLVGFWKGETNTLSSTGSNHGYPLPVPGSLLSDVAVLTITGGAELRLSNAGVAEGNFQATVTGPSGTSCLVQKTSNFSTWTPVVTNAAPFTFSDPIGGGNSVQFYRAVSPP